MTIDYIIENKLASVAIMIFFFQSIESIRGTLNAIEKVVDNVCPTSSIEKKEEDGRRR